MAEAPSPMRHVATLEGSGDSRQTRADPAGHAETAWSLAWNPKYPLLATCSTDRDVRLHSYTQLASAVADDTQVLFTLKEVIPTGHKRTVRQVAWSPSGEMFATASFDSSVGIWERVQPTADGDEPAAAADGEWDCSGTLEGHDSECKAAAFSHNGSLLASCSRDKSVWVWEVQPDSEFECLSVMMEHSQDVKTVAWHPHEELLASASYDDMIKLYIDDPSEDWFCYATLSGHTSTVWSLAFSPCGRFLASASDDCTIRIWRRLNASECAAAGQAPEGVFPGRAGDKWVQVQCISHAHTRSIYSVSWAPGNESDDAQAYGLIASAGGDGRILVHSLGKAGDDQVPYPVLASRVDRAHAGAEINCVAWAPTAFDGAPRGAHFLASAGDDGAVHVWTLRP